LHNTRNGKSWSGVCDLFRGASEDPQNVGSWHGKAPWFEITDDLPQYAEYAPPG
jgi:hypothetical protein